MSASQRYSPEARQQSMWMVFDYEADCRCGPYQHLESMEFATLEWIDWFNHRRLLDPIDNVPPAERGVLYYQEQSQA